MSAPDATKPVGAGSVLVSRYRLVRLVAHGGMASVWEAHDNVLARSVAVKVLHPHLAEDRLFLERFRREAISAARLAHPNVVATFDAGITAEGTAFIVMELIRGRTLSAFAAEYRPLPIFVCVGIAMQIAEALAHAHAAGLVHRDIKPANVLVCDTESDGVPHIKVTDFGIAKAAEGLGLELTKTGMILGTPRYLSPEQIDGREPDARADLYALGVVLFELVGGLAPFRGATEMAVAVQHLNEVPARLRDLRPATPMALDQLVAGLLAKQPDARPPSAAAVRQALQRIDTSGSRTQPLGGPADRTSVGPPAPARPPAGNSGDDPYAGTAAGPPASPGVDPRGSPDGGPWAGSGFGPPSGGARGPLAGPAIGPPSGGALGGPPSGNPGDPYAGTAAGPLAGAPRGPLSGSGVGPPTPPRPITPEPGRAGVAAGPAAGRATPASGLGDAARRGAPGGGAAPPWATPPPERQPPPYGRAQTSRTARTPPPRRPNYAGRLVAALVVVALIVVVVVISNHGTTGHHFGAGTPSATTAVPITVQGATVFHLERDADDAAHATFAIDGNPNTAWQTDRYFGAHFAGLRNGLGLALTLDSTKTLHTLTVTSATPGWSAEVYVADAVPDPPALAPWGAPLDSKQNVAGPITTFDLHGHSGGAILLWLTDLGPTFQASIAEITVH